MLSIAPQKEIAVLFFDICFFSCFCSYHRIANLFSPLFFNAFSLHRLLFLLIECNLRCKIVCARLQCWRARENMAPYTLHVSRVRYKKGLFSSSFSSFLLFLFLQLAAKIIHCKYNLFHQTHRFLQCDLAVQWMDRDSQWRNQKRYKQVRFCNFESRRFPSFFKLSALTFFHVLVCSVA